MLITMRLVILIILPMITIPEVRSDCKFDNREDDEIILNCTGISVERDGLLKDSIDPNKAKELANTLRIRDSNIPEINSHFFESYSTITRIFINNANLSDIRPFSFSWSKLEELDVSNNNITEIVLEAFAGVEGTLIKVDFSYNKLTVLENISNLKSVELLNYTHNNLLKIKSGAFKNQEALRVLDLSKNKLNSLEYINKVHTLQVLNISFNLIESITEYDFQQLESLKILDMTENLLTNLSPKLFIHSKQLTDLFLRNNSIKSFSNDLFYKSISHVDISLNIMKYIQCEQIQGSVNMSYNYIDSVCHFGENVTTIDFSECDLPSIPKGAFKQLTKLNSLNLTKNFIETIDVDAFENLKNLTHLFLSWNDFHSLEIGTFHQLTSLEHLDLAFNFLEVLQHGIFNGLTSLRILDLSHNSIEYLDYTIFYSVSKLEELNLAHNPLITFDTYSLTDNMGNLRQLTVNFHKIGCEELAGKLRRLRIDDVKVEQGKHFKGNNVNGISCNPDDESSDIRSQAYAARRAINFVKGLRAIFFLITAAFFILVVMHCMAWYKKNISSNKRSMTKNGPSCSLTLLTEDDQD